MPYPLEKLQYGLRQRLRKLATRSEAYALQIAAPNYSGFQPIQKVRSLAHAQFIINKENNLPKLLGSQQPEILHETPLYIVSNDLTFYKFMPDVKLATILDDYLFAPKYLQFFDCMLDEMFVQSFVNVVNNPVRYIRLCPSSFTSENGAKIFCNSPAFRALEGFTVMKSFPSSIWWITAFMKAKCTSLKEFTVHDAPLSVFEIDREVLLNFIKAQRKNFALRFLMSNDIEWDTNTEQLLNNLFDEHFERCEYSPEKKVVLIACYKEETKYLKKCYALLDD